MIEKAIEKIKEEMEKNKAPYIQAIGNYVLCQVKINIEAAKEIVESKKTLKDALKIVTAKAKEKAVDNCAILTDEEVYKIVREYYEFKAEQSNATQTVIKEEYREKEKTKEEKKNFSVDLNSLLRR